ncbi:DNA helicase-2 / ATP-dependent DNA helicase PcrA [Thiothrix caldifontis]|uniref:DNA 3'-5' helicase II n=1 Tax=Thiothrix caldifontis TaxID=525918 RepID=A0A1H4FU40_9GAMM|nr:UvrD-helicase domain-containing protein [Thiothrix caldifontis]SEB00032.1 DNA helicase-2 / ATP-dependent DNA helicase PcrA [Thiothrix caldifontis]
MVSIVETGNPDTDDAVDNIIEECLNPELPKSFFLYAGAGSGKTYSLVKGLETFEKTYGTKFRRTGRKVAVITYTNAACDEIIERVKGDPLFHISTIHSFCWLQIKTFHDDIRYWLREMLPLEIAELEQKEAKGRSGMASITRKKSIANKLDLLNWLSTRQEFTYNPNGNNIGKSSLSHSEVVKICADFLISKPSFQQIIINRYPFILIDESQDTNKYLIDALFALEKQHQGHFGLGLIGDMMQRIYGDGKSDLGQNIPKHWATPVKKMNRRSPSRIVALANDIRYDHQEQKVIDGKPDGHVRFFIASANKPNKPEFECAVRENMAKLTGDTLWSNPEEVKHLMLEHMMAAVRMGFAPMFGALSASSRLSTALRGGDLPAVRLFSEYVLPLYQLEKAGAGHAVMTHLRRMKSPLLLPDFLKAVATQENPLAILKNSIREMIDVIDVRPDVSFFDVLQCVVKYNLFPIPQSLVPFAEKVESLQKEDEPETNLNEEEEQISNLEAIQNFLQTPFKQIEAYKTYVSGTGAFDTHQGVKGREFERVLVVMDDDEAGGFLFSYEKMFEVKPLTKADIEKLTKGEETGIDKTKRLFYITCTRAEKSLALVAYSQNPQLLRTRIIAKGWFEENEVIVV